MDVGVPRVDVKLLGREIKTIIASRLGMIVTLTHTGYITGLRGWNETPVAKKVQGVDVFAQGMKWGSCYWKSATWAQEGAAIKKAIESFAQGTDVKEALDVAAEETKAARSQ
jgi:hypothetical protein